MAFRLIDKNNNELLVNSDGSLSIKNASGSTEQVVGSSASDVTDDSANPIKIGGVASTTAPVGATSGKRKDLWVGTTGNVMVGQWSSTAADGATPGALLDQSGAVRPTSVAGWNFNGTNWDRQRGNLDNISAVASAAYNSTQTQADQVNYNHRGIVVVADATAVTGSGIFTFSIQGKDPVSAKYYSLLTSANVVGVSTNVYTVYPGATVAANVSASAPLPRTWRIVATYVSGTSLTFSVGAALIL